jgi:hypothetical protein
MQISSTRETKIRPASKKCSTVYDPYRLIYNSQRTDPIHSQFNLLHIELFRMYSNILTSTMSSSSLSFSLKSSGQILISLILFSKHSLCAQ